MSLAMELTRMLVWPARAQGRAKSADPEMPKIMAANRTAASPPKALHRRYVIGRETVGVTPVVTLTPRTDQESKTTLLYTAGGTYSSPIGNTHWTMLDHLLRRATPTRLVVPLALLAPEHTLDDALPDLVQIYAQTRAHSERVVLGGDSSGGGLALAITQQSQAQGIALPDALLLLSPWVDVTLPSAQSAEMEPHDPVMRMAGPRAMGRVWAGGRSVSDPLVSPVHADMRGWPHMAVLHAGHDLSLPDTRRFIDSALDQGVEVTDVLESAAFHVYPIAWWTPEAHRAAGITANLLAA